MNFRTRFLLLIALSAASLAQAAVLLGVDDDLTLVSWRADGYTKGVLAPDKVILTLRVRVTLSSLDNGYLIAAANVNKPNDLVTVYEEGVSKGTTEQIVRITAGPNSPHTITVLLWLQAHPRKSGADPIVRKDFSFDLGKYYK